MKKNYKQTETGKKMFIEMQQKDRELKEARIKEKEEASKKYEQIYKSRKTNRSVERSDKGNKGTTNVGY